MQIINETRITAEENKKMNIYLYRRRLIIILIILECLMIGISALIFFGLEEPIFALLILILSIIFPFVLFINLKIAFNRVKKTNKIIVSEPLVHYEFFEDYFTVVMEEKGFCSKSDYYYEVLCAIIEAPDYLYFFITFNQVLIVSKNGFISGSTQNLIKYINKYIKKSI